MLQIQNISKEYRTGDLVQWALDGVSLNLRDSEFVTVLGPSGSGKTTLLNIIGGLDRYDSGDLIINGVSTKEYNDRDWDTYRNHSIGFVFQSYNLIGHQNVLSNVELALTISGISGKERRERAKKALEQVGLGEQIYKKPNQMSGGQMQRVALARALVNDPDILLADEPTGALDTETSIQVMDLMQQVAKDRLVVMVTHNPELAEQYASRIVRLRDGQITDDSMPFSDEEVSAALSEEKMTEDVSATEEQVDVLSAGTEEQDGEQRFARESAGKEKKKKASMSFLTSLALSFSNLRTKKGRTILTSLAGSIGIIGIALILSLSTGVNNYIDKIQRETMSSYPITISSTSFDLASLMVPGGQYAEEEEETDSVEEHSGRVGINYGDMETNSAVTTSIKENNLTQFKKYLDDPSSEIHSSIGENGIVYTYDVDFKVYSYDDNHKLVDTDLDVTSEFTDDNNVLGNLHEARSLMLSNASSMFGGFGDQSASNFSEMMAGANGDKVSALIKDNYDVVYGSWPNNYDEVVIVLSKNEKLLSGTMYQLGLITKAQYEAAVRKVENEEKPESIYLDYKELCDHEFYLLTACDQYRKNDNGTFTAIGDDEDSLNAAMEHALKLKVVGIVKPSEDADLQDLNTPVAYTTELTDYLIRHINSSEVIESQKKIPELDVLSGQPFTTVEPDDNTKAMKGREYLENLSYKGKSDAFSSLMLIDYEGCMEALMTNQMGELAEKLSAELETAIASAMESSMSLIMDQIAAQMKQAQAQAEEAYAAVMKKVVQEMVSQAISQLVEKITAEYTDEKIEQIKNEIFPQLMNITVMQSTDKILTAMEEQLPEGLPKALRPLKKAKNIEELTEAIRSLDPSALEGINFSSLDFSKIDFTDIDYSSIDLSVLYPDGIDLSNLSLDDLDFSNVDLSGIDMSGIDLNGMDLGAMDFSSLDFSGIDFGGIDLSSLGASMSGFSLSADEGDMAAITDYWLQNIATPASLVKVYDRFIGVSSYDSNMKKFGMISYDAPTSISLYADSFEGKDGLTTALRNYNDGASEENKITYTDYVALLTSSVTTIINAISFVLIGFVAVSLFVSCIMIGIITNISVLERTKEIGVLRALGASKRNISNVFNAETFIVGCFSGIIGVGISLLLTLPINAVIHMFVDNDALRANLPPLSALILILISIAITIIGGLIPSRKAARQDPVIALRSE